MVAVAKTQCMLLPCQGPRRSVPLVRVLSLLRLRAHLQLLKLHLLVHTTAFFGVNILGRNAKHKARGVHMRNARVCMRRLPNYHALLLLVMIATHDEACVKQTVNTTLYTCCTRSLTNKRVVHMPCFFALSKQQSIGAQIKQLQ
jgi:hypothetical protein